MKLTSARNVFLMFLASLLSLSSIGISNSSAIAFPAKESVPKNWSGITAISAEL